MYLRKHSSKLCAKHFKSIEASFAEEDEKAISKTFAVNGLYSELGNKQPTIETALDKTPSSLLSIIGPTQTEMNQWFQDAHFNMVLEDALTASDPDQWLIDNKKP